MIGRAVVLACGLGGAVGLSQMPEFSQQYIQRMGGAVDELRGFVADFDADAVSVGLTREEALLDLKSGGALGAARADTVGQMIGRYQQMSEALAAIQGAGPFTRAYTVAKVPDRDVAQATWAAYQPAVPFTVEGGMFGAAGFLGGWLGSAILMGLLKWPFRRRKPAGDVA